MPPQADPRAATADKQIKALTTFCVRVQNTLPSSVDQPSIELILSELADNLRVADSLLAKRSKLPKAVQSTTRDGLDRQAVALWNHVLRLSREDSTGTAYVSGATTAAAMRRGLLRRCQFFAFRMVDLARTCGNESGEAAARSLVRIWDLALKVAKYSIDVKALDDARNALTYATDYHSRLSALNQIESDASRVVTCKMLEAEHFVVRTALSWKEDRLDVAEHMYGQADPLKETLNPATAEKLADVLFEIGKDLSGKKDFTMAAKWLDRAYAIIDAQELASLSRDAMELRLSICQALVHALIGVQKPEHMEEAEKLISEVELEIGDKPVVLLLRLELLQATPGEMFDAQAYATVLRRMVWTFDLSNAHLNLLKSHIRTLHDKSPELSVVVLEEWMQRKVVQSEQMEWIEKLVILRVWMSTSTSHDRHQPADDISRLSAFLTTTQENLNHPFSATAAVAAQTLVWTKLEAVYSQQQFSLAEAWCEVALHGLFKTGGPTNQAKISRKFILCAIATNNYEKAKAAFQAMSEAAQNDVKTRHLMFKIAVRSSDQKLAMECLQSMAAGPSNDRNLIYACVLDAQQAGDRYCAAEALKALVFIDEQSIGEVHLPTLFRCTIRLLRSNLEAEEASSQELAKKTAEEICAVLGQVVKTAQQDPRDSNGAKLFTADEIFWLCRNLYNMGLSYLNIWSPRQTVSLFESCISLSDLLPLDVAVDDARDMSLNRSLCHFVVAAALVAVARAEDDISQVHQDYHTMRQHVEAFDREFQSNRAKLPEVTVEDLSSKLAMLLVFDFEAAICLKSWEDLGEIVRKAEPCCDANAFKQMADCLLRQSGVPSQALYSTMKQLVNEIWKLERFNVERLAKYLRLLFQAVLPLDGSAALQIIDQARDMARDAEDTTHPLPQLEIEWLATTAFNHAVDLYGMNDDEGCKDWATKAINLAHYCDDGGILEKTCQSQYLSLKFG